MKCMHCGKEIENDSRFCTFCGGENQPQAAKPTVDPVKPPESELPDVQWVPEPRPEMYQKPVRQAPPQPASRPMPPMGYPQPPQQKKGGAWKWVVAFVWLALVIIGWAAALLLTTGGRKDEASDINAIIGNGGLTEGQWYQWDLHSDTLYGWTFGEDGTAVYGIPGKNETSTVAYNVDGSGAVVIGYDDGAAVWVYDSAENCYWQYTAVDGQTYKTRIFRASDYPAGNAMCYSYRTEDGGVNVQTFYENITELNADTAAELIRWYNTHANFGVCSSLAPVSKEEADEVLLSAGCDRANLDWFVVNRVTCCQSQSQSREHLAHYLGDDVLSKANACEAQLIEYNGGLYMAVGLMSTFVFEIDGEITDCGDGRWTVPLKMGIEGEIFYSSAIFGKEGGTFKLLSVEKAVSSAMTKERAQELMSWYNQYESFGVCNSVEGVSGEEAKAVLRSAGYDSQYLDMYGVSRVVCCHSVNESREHLSHYLGADILNSQNLYEAKPIEYNGNLYMVAAPMGYPGYYIDGNLTDQGEGVWTVPVKFDYEDTAYTAFFRLEGGEYKLISIENAGSPALTADAAWNLIEQANFDNLIGYFYANGSVDDQDVYYIYPHSGDPTHAVDCPSVSGVDSEEDMLRLLRRHYTDRCAEQIVRNCQVSREEADRGTEGWFAYNGTIYFVPNWGRGSQMLFREGMTVTQRTENVWTVSLAMEFTDERAEFHIVYEDGTFKIDI